MGRDAPPTRLSRPTDYALQRFARYVNLGCSEGISR